jgi:hypothetical protein
MLALLGISFMAPVAGASRLKGLAAGGLGLMLATIGLDPLTSTPRFTFGHLALWDGIGPIPAALGLFAIPEIASLSGMQMAVVGSPPAAESSRTGLVDGVRDVGRLWTVTLLGSAIGAFGGLLPGMGASVSQWLAYARVSRRRPEGAAFGQGAIEGVIAPSAANNATLGGSLVPALALGIPGGLMSALLLSALLLKGLLLSSLHAGPLYAYVDRDDRHHEACLELLETHPGPLLVPMLVMGNVALLASELDRPIGVHAHHNLGLAVANSLAAIQGGVLQVECSINGIGERAGNASLEEVVMAMKVRNDVLPYWTNVDATMLTRVSKLVSVNLSKLAGRGAASAPPSAAATL